VEPETRCLDPCRLTEALTPRARGIIAIHLYGHPADMDAINAFAAAHGRWVVEAAAEAPLARCKGRTTGGLGRIGAFSFYGNKVLTAGEGGAVTLDDPELERRARLFRGQGQDPARRCFLPVVGHDSRLTNSACALLCVQFERRDGILARRRAVMARDAERLAVFRAHGWLTWAVYRRWLHDRPMPVWLRFAIWMLCARPFPAANRMVAWVVRHRWKLTGLPCWDLAPAFASWRHQRKGVR